MISEAVRLTVVPKDHHINVEAFAVVTNSLQSIDMWFGKPTSPVEAGKFEIQGAKSEWLKNMVEVSADEAQIQHIVLWENIDALLQDGINKLCRELVHRSSVCNIAS